MGSNAVAALISNADSHINHFLGQRIKRPRTHDLLDIFPCTLQRGWIMRDRLPEVIDPVSLASSHDVVVNRTHLRAGIFVFDKSQCCHERFDPLNQFTTESQSHRGKKDDAKRFSLWLCV